MSVYVDPQSYSPMTREWRHAEASRMFADTTEELHAFAVKLGLMPHEFQDVRVKHYLLNRAFRNLAIDYGAVEVGSFEAMRLWVKLGYWSKGMLQTMERE